MQYFAVDRSAFWKLGGISFSDMQNSIRLGFEQNTVEMAFDLPQWKDVVTLKTGLTRSENSRSVRALELYVNGKKWWVETFWAVFNTEIRRPEALALPFEHLQLYRTKATENLFPLTYNSKHELERNFQAFVNQVFNVDVLIELIRYFNRILLKPSLIEFLHPKNLMPPTLQNVPQRNIAQIGVF